MPAVVISEPLFAEASQYALAHGISLEELVGDALKIHLVDEAEGLSAVYLTEDQISGVQQAQDQLAAGQGLNLEVVTEMLRENRERCRTISAA
jgi:hypothetical protein